MKKQLKNAKDLQKHNDPQLKNFQEVLKLNVPINQFNNSILAIPTERPTYLKGLKQDIKYKDLASTVFNVSSSNLEFLII